MFKALVLEQDDGKTVASVRQLDETALPDEEVLIAVRYSSLNYKDGLAVTGTGKIVRRFPMVPGIDLAGKVVESRVADIKPGDEVILTGWGVGESHWGGYSQLARAKADWLVPMPGRLDARRAMIIGTAGLTAMLCVMTLEEGGIRPKSGPVLVTGAAGGVGSIAVLLLSRLGYAVTAVSGRSENHEYLKSLGAVEVIGREAMQIPAKPLESQRWRAAIDVVGGDILARVLAEMDYNGVVAACGLAADYHLNTTVMPFILRNVSLRGVDSVVCPRERRIKAWQRLAAELPESAYDSLATTIGLEQVAHAASAILAGKVRGRVLVDPNR